MMYLHTREEGSFCYQVNAATNLARQISRVSYAEIEILTQVPENAL